MAPPKQLKPRLWISSSMRRLVFVAAFMDYRMY